MAHFDLSKYETVQQRLDIFHQLFPEGRVITQLVEASDKRYIIVTSLFKDSTSLHPFATGIAEETVGSSPVNKTSAIENCETSSIGRALRNGGIGKDASREEMEKVERGSSEPKPAKQKAVKVVPADDVIAAAFACTTLDELREVYRTASADVLSTPHAYIRDDGFKINATVGEYLQYLAAALGQSS